MKFKQAWFNWRVLVIEDRRLSFHAKGLALYLNTFMNDSHDFAFPSLRRIESEMSLSRKTVIKYLEELESTGWIKKGKILSPTTSQYHNTYTVLIPEEIAEIGGGGDTPPKQKVVETAPKGGGSQGIKVVEDVHPNKQGNKQMNKQVRFRKPKFEELKTYIEQNKYKVDPQKFLDHYDTVGWVVGKNKTPMKNWQAAVRTWNTSHKERNPEPASRVRYDAFGRPRKENGQGDLL